MGNHTTVTVAAQSGNFQLNVMLPLIAKNLLESIHLLSNALPILADQAIVGFTINQKRVEENLAQSHSGDCAERSYRDTILRQKLPNEPIRRSVLCWRSR